ncbi:putative glutathione S-transferase [Jackrogersella minutella]|nr:putative glutathione S-transferase [Jackrogersella minutella]
MSEQEIVFFDLPSRPPCKTWTANLWKTRLFLNYKGLPYKTEWIEYPDIKPRFEGHLPKADIYTCPTVILPDGKWVMDSTKIAEALEERYPEPSTHLDSPYLPKVSESLTGIMIAIRAVYIPGVFFNLLNEASLGYFRRTREEFLGVTIEEFAKGAAGAWEKAAPHAEKITALLKENSDGPFFEGKTVGYVDFIWAGYLLFMEAIGKDVLAEALKVTGDAEVHLKLLEAVRPWSERADH